MVVTALVVTGISILLTYIFSEYAGYGNMEIARFFSISYIGGVIGILAILFKIRILKAMFLSISPMLIFLVGYLVYVGITGETSSPMLTTLYMPIITHTPHIIIAILLVIEKENPITPSDLFVGFVIWAIEISLSYLLIPNFHMFYTLDYKTTMIIMFLSFFISYISLYVTERKNSKRIVKINVFSSL